MGLEVWGLDLMGDRGLRFGFRSVDWVSAVTYHVWF